MARVAAPFIRRTEAFREQRRGNVDGVYEIALHFVINTLTKNGIRFDPVMIVNGQEEVERALAAGRGVLLISPHTALSLLVVRFFHDAGCDPTVIAADPQMRVPGTGVTATTIQPSPTFLVAARTRLRNGSLVCAMPDRAEHTEGRTVEFNTPNGRIILAPALMQLAARCGAKVVFLKVHVEERGIIADMVAPSPVSDGSADAITADFIQFVQAHVEARHASHN